MLLKEKLEDHGMKKVELDRSVSEKKLEMLRALQTKLANVGRTDDKIDLAVKTLETQVTAWRAADDANKPKAKRALALNVVRT
jgi:hypothetical protein